MPGPLPWMLASQDGDQKASLGSAPRPSPARPGSADPNRPLPPAELLARMAALAMPVAGGGLRPT